MNNIILLFLEKICEAIYFSLFLIYGKNLKEKRILFIGIMIFEYLALKYFIKFNVLFQLSYTFMTYLTLKVLYKEKAQITDIFTFTIASIMMIVIDMLAYFISSIFTNNFIVIVIIDKIAIFVTLFLLRNKLPNIQKLYKRLWNRNDKETKKIKSTTFRCINLIIFNVTFYVLNIIILYAIYINSIS